MVGMNEITFFFARDKEVPDTTTSTKILTPPVMPIRYFYYWRQNMSTTNGQNAKAAQSRILRQDSYGRQQSNLLCADLWHFLASEGDFIFFSIKLDRNRRRTLCGTPTDLSSY